jgi:1-acyl-sn-glycerol-3-phosphate acyltransferase
VNIFYWAGYLLTFLVFRLLFGYRRFFTSRLPRRGALILAPNHASHLDPLAVGIATKREVHFMARSTLFRPAWFGVLIRSLNAHPVYKNKGMFQDWDHFIGLLRLGKALLVFPEGTRSKDGQLQPGQGGFGKLAHACRVPVFPVYIHGSHSAFAPGGKLRFLPIHVAIGEAVELEDLFAQPETKATLKAITERVMQGIARTREEYLALPHISGRRKAHAH